MASLSMKELSKRNNFNIFTKRISIGQGFYVVGMDELILLDTSILDSIDDLEGLRHYEEKNSILLPTKGGNKIKLTGNFYEFSTQVDLELENNSLHAVKLKAIGQKELNACFYLQPKPTRKNKWQFVIYEPNSEVEDDKKKYFREVEIQKFYSKKDLEGKSGGA